MGLTCSNLMLKLTDEESFPMNEQRRWFLGVKSSPSENAAKTVGMRAKI